MAYTRQIFSYNNEEDRDIHKWLESLPQKQISKYIRIALRTYLSYLVDQDHQQAFLSDFREQIDGQREYLEHLENQISAYQKSLTVVMKEISEQQEGLTHFLADPKNDDRSVKRNPTRKSSTETYKGYEHPLFNKKDEEISKTDNDNYQNNKDEKKMILM